MKLDKLIWLNKNIKRKLVEKFEVNVCKFRDGRNRIFDPKPIGIPHSTSVSEVEDPFNDKKIKGNPYYINKDRIQGFLTKNEVSLILGVDYSSGAKPLIFMQCWKPVLVGLN